MITCTYKPQNEYLRKVVASLRHEIRYTKPETILSLDTETTGLDVHGKARPFAISIGYTFKPPEVIEYSVDPATGMPDYPKTNKRLDKLKREIDKAQAIVFHNAKFDIRALMHVGIEPTYIDKVEDTSLMSHVLDSDPADHFHALKPLGIKYLDILDDDEDKLKAQVSRLKSLVTRKSLFELRKEDPGYWLPKHFDPSSTLLADYAAIDAERTIKLFILFSSWLNRVKLVEQYDQQRKLLKPIAGMELRGMRLLPEKTQAIQVKLKQDVEDTKAYLAKASKRKDFNPNSPVQISKLFTDLRVQTFTRTAKKNVSYAKEALEEVKELYKGKQRRCIDSLLQYRATNVALSQAESYLEKAVKLGHKVQGQTVYLIHPTFKITGPSTTRFASENPNGQNIKKRGEPNLRSLFGPRPGYLWYDIDYANIELRLFAYAANEKGMINCFESGESGHLVLGQVLYGPSFDKHHPGYSSVKNGNFSLIYGAGPKRADATYGIPGAYEKIAKYLPAIPNFLNGKAAEARRRGYIETMFGYRLKVSPREPHKAGNYYIQGTAGDVLKFGILAVELVLEKYNVGAVSIATVHDQLVIEVPTSEDTPKLRKDVNDALESPGVMIGIATPTEFGIVKDQWSNSQAIEV